MNDAPHPEGRASRRMSTSVMARRGEPPTSLDYFPTPPWATRALLEHVLPELYPWQDRHAGIACDPACGEGHMAEVLAERFAHVQASDIFGYGYGAVADFTDPLWTPPGPDGGAGGGAAPHWIVTNPPFNRAQEFARLALARARRGVALLVRTAFLEGRARYSLFSERPPQLVAQFVERVPMHRGRWVIDGSTATSYAWACWLIHPPHDWRHTRLVWIPPSRRALERPDDPQRFGACSDLPKGHPARAGR